MILFQTLVKQVQRAGRRIQKTAPLVMEKQLDHLVVELHVVVLNGCWARGEHEGQVGDETVVEDFLVAQFRRTRLRLIVVVVVPGQCEAFQESAFG